MTFKTILKSEKAIKDLCAWRTPVMYSSNQSHSNNHVLTLNGPIDETTIANETTNLFLTFLQKMMYLYRVDNTVPIVRLLVECQRPVHFDKLFSLYENFAESPFLSQIQDMIADFHLCEHNLSSFKNLLRTVFKVPNNLYEQIIGIYYFCSRILISCLLDELYGSFQIVLSWTLQFLKNDIPEHIINACGWEAVLNNCYNEPISVIVKVLALISVGYLFSKHMFFSE